MPITGGISWPPSEADASIAAACSRGMPAPIMAGIVTEPMVAALAAPLPLTVPTAQEPNTADCGSACEERAAMRFAVTRIESTAPNARSRLSTSRNEPISVSASCGSRE
jgi:hypothetical protein